MKSWQYCVLLKHGHVVLIMKANEMHCFSNLFDKVPYMFRTGHASSVGVC